MGQAVESWVELFDNVLFPLLTELLRLEVYGLDPVGMSETRLRACALLCKIFLGCLGKVGVSDLPRLWGEVLGYVATYLAQGGETVSFLIYFFFFCFGWYLVGDVSITIH